jgi:hypothetical protein
MNFSTEPYSVGARCIAVVSRVDTYRENADECRRQAERSLTLADKERWLKIAEHWLQMAQEADKDTGG